MIALATIATVIASQAMLSGAFSLTLQAVQLGYLPPLRITHTSAAQHGQIYFGVVNWLMFVGTVGLILSFGSSSNLAAAYGIAVSGSMIITTLLMYRVAHTHWQWSPPLAALVVGGFLLIDFAFFLANAQKIPHGGWFPLLLGAAIFTVMSTWARGRAIVADHLSGAISSPDGNSSMRYCRRLSVEQPGGLSFCLSIRMSPRRPCCKMSDTTNHSTNRSICSRSAPSTCRLFRQEDRWRLPSFKKNLFQVVARCGFMETPDIPRVLTQLAAHGHVLPVEETTFFLSRITFWRHRNQEWRSGEKNCLWFCRGDTQRASSYFHLPAEQVVEIGLVLEI